MDIIEALIKKPLFIIPIASAVIGALMLLAARGAYQRRTKKLFTIVTPSTLTDEYNSFEKKLVVVGIILGILGIVGLPLISSIYKK